MAHTVTGGDRANIVRPMTIGSLDGCVRSGQMTAVATASVETMTTRRAASTRFTPTLPMALTMRISSRLL